MSTPSRAEKTTGSPEQTVGEVEAAVAEGFTQFQQEFMGRGPKGIRVRLFGDMLLIRLTGVLTAAEQNLVKSLTAERGRDLVKAVRSELIESARPALEALVASTTGVKPVSLHHDISTSTGEEIIIFTLLNAPTLRATPPR